DGHVTGVQTCALPIYVPQLFHRAPSGWNSGSVTSSLILVNTTSTGMSQRMTLGSGATLIRFDIMRGPSASSIMASTYGVGIFQRSEERRVGKGGRSWR